MKVFTPEISWHQKEPIFSVDFCNSTWRLASAGADFTIKTWQVKEDSEGNVGLDFLSNLDRHAKPVNCVRFSPDGRFLASAGDDCIIIIWKLSEDGDDHMTGESSFGNEDIVNKEKWTVHKMLRRGHLEDIYDLSWSPDGTQLISGSVDNSAIIWDVNKGHFTNIIKDHNHYVQGVCWDPRGQYVVTHSSDRTCKVYSLTKDKCIQTIHKATFPLPKPTEDGKTLKTCKLFMDETMQSFFRRCSFSPDGLLLVLPGGTYEVGEKPIKATYVFARGSFNKPALCLPGSKKATVGACFCPILFENMDSNGDKENATGSEGMFKLPYRMCYAVATLDSVVFYDTQHPYPFGFVSNVHYASLTDMAWSSDGRILVVSSLDGYCSIISFKDGELGKASEIDPMEYVSNKLKAKREAKKEVMKEKQKDQPERKINTPSAAEKEQGGLARIITPAKDQPTLHQFITPVRKRKRPSESGQTTPTTNSPKNLVGHGTPDSPHDLTGSVKAPALPDVSMKSPQPPLQQAANRGVTESTPNFAKLSKTPKRANLISLGFKPIARTPTSSGKEQCLDGDEKKPANSPSSSNTDKSAQPRRISFTTLNAQKNDPSKVESKTISDQAPANVTLVKDSTKAQDPQWEPLPSQGKPSSASNSPNAPVKPARRVSLVSLSIKRDHSGAAKPDSQKSDTSSLATSKSALSQPALSTPAVSSTIKPVSVVSDKVVPESSVSQPNTVSEIGSDSVVSKSVGAAIKSQGSGSSVGQVSNLVYQVVKEAPNLTSSSVSSVSSNAPDNVEVIILSDDTTNTPSKPSMSDDDTAATRSSSSDLSKSEIAMLNPEKKTSKHREKSEDSVSEAAPVYGKQEQEGVFKATTHSSQWETGNDKTVPASGVTKSPSCSPGEKAPRRVAFLTLGKAGPPRK